jgi:NAD(P)-dependent dehydrogenase (short-subunit alcohol dehydrogenase family)
MLMRRLAGIRHPSSTRDLRDKRVLLVGASGGIGKATCEELRRLGARVVGIDRKADTGVLEADITDREAVQSAVTRAIEELGGLDILVNVAGVGLPCDAGAIPGEEVELTLRVNLLGPWLVTACALPALLASRGRVITVASGLAFANVPFAAAYAASKRAVAAWSDALRLEYGSHIDVTTVYPGYIKTPIHAASLAAGVSLEGLVREEPLRATVRTLARACQGRPKRDMTTTRLGALEIGLARHFPALVDLIIMARLNRLNRAGHYTESKLAKGMLERWNGTH